MKQRCSSQSEFTKNFEFSEIENAIKDMKSGKAAGLDGIFMEFIKNFGVKTKTWLLILFNDILFQQKLPKLFKKTKVLAVLKPAKDGSSASHYRPISLMSIVYKLFEKLLLNRLQPHLDKIIPKEQAGFRPSRGCVEQVLALTTHIENGFQKGLKTFVVFFDLTAAYNTVWREGLLWKLMKIIPCKKLSALLNLILSNRFFQVSLNERKSTWKRLNNGLSQGSVLAPLLFNVYTSDIPVTKSRLLLYADDLAIVYQCSTFEEAEKVLEEDLKVVFNNYNSWRLKPNSSKL